MNKLLIAFLLALPLVAQLPPWGWSPGGSGGSGSGTVNTGADTCLPFFSGAGTTLDDINSTVCRFRWDATEHTIDSHDSAGVKTASWDTDTGIWTSFGTPGPITMAHLSSIAEPAASYNNIGPKANGEFYIRGPGGAEKPLLSGARHMVIEVIPDGTAASTGDNKAKIPIPDELVGLVITRAWCTVGAVGTTGTLNVDVAKCAGTATGNECSGTVADVLSTNLTVDSNENKSATAAAAAVIDTANDDLIQYDVLRFDIDAIHTTPSQGLRCGIVAQRP